VALAGLAQGALGQPLAGGTFQIAQTYTVPSGSMVVADVNGDGILDPD
jgi:signal peptidase I